LSLIAKTSKEVRYSKREVEAIKRNYLPSSSNAPSKAFPASGSQNLLLILINYPDQPNTYPNSNFDDLMNTTGYNGTGSFQDYYLANSFGQLTMVTTVSGWYTAANNHDYYCDACTGADPNNTYRELVREAVDAAEAAGVDFSIFDNDGDGAVDGVMIIHQGDGAEYGDNTNVWSHSWSLYDLAVTYDGVLIDDYTMNPESTPSGMGSIGVICHEFGHNLGVPDYYDTDYSGSGGQSFDLGDWDCMAGGSYNNGGATPASHNSYSKNLLGWQTATELVNPQAITLANAAENNESFYYSTPTANEYFWVENRQQISGTFDEYIPGHGMLIYHIDENYSGWSNNRINADPAHNGMDIEEADNIATSGTVTSDPFPGTSSVTSFTDITVPNSISWAGANTAKPITGIVESAGEISFAFMGGASCTEPTTQASAFTSSALADNSMTIGWNRGDGDAVLIVARKGGAVNVSPTNGIAYTPDAVFGNGTEIGSGNFVVYNGTGTSENISSLLPGTTYYYAVYEYISATNCYLTPALIENATTTGIAPIVYCIASATTCDEFISNVTLGTINNSTDCSSGGYADYSAFSTDMGNGSSELITITNGNSYSSDQCGIWVDWNNNGDFLDDEAVAVSGTPGVGPYSATLNCPADALPGLKRVRIRIHWSDETTSPCDNAVYGEVEDYSINVISVSCPKPNSLFASNVSHTSATLNWVAGNAESEWDVEWGAEGFAQGSGTMVFGITTNSLDLSALSVDSQYQFYVRAVCGVADTSSWSGPYSFTTLSLSMPVGLTANLLDAENCL
jgi:M6 family metalloprotease-like protein